MPRDKIPKAVSWHGHTLSELANIEAGAFFARYSDQAERVAQLVLEKIRAKKTGGNHASTARDTKTNDLQ